MILVYDFLSTGYAHVPFNIGYLAVLRHACPDLAIRFHGEATHLDALRQSGARDFGIDLEAIAPRREALVPHRQSVLDLFGSSEAVAGAVRSARSTAAGLLAILGGSADTLRTLRRQADSIPGTQIDVILHGMGNWLEGWRSAHPVRRHFDFRSELARPLPGNVRVVVLERAIASQLADRFPARRGDTIVLEHPISPGEQSLPTRQHRPGQPVNVGFLGWASVDKGFHLFLGLARKFAGPDLRFHAIGPRDESLPAAEDGVLATPPAARPLSRADFLAQLATLDVVCLPLRRPEYDWASSGSVIDCISHRVPLLAGWTTVLHDLWERYGPLGFLCRDEAEFHAVLDRELLQARAAGLDTFRANLAQVRADRLPQALARWYPGPAIAAGRTALR